MVSTEYHQATKHHFNRFARSLGYLDWATQPDPFRRHAGAPLVELPRQPLRASIPYDALYSGAVPPAPIDLPAIGEFLRCSLGLSAWKQHQASRWALRVNPSSGNLHPTEAYVVWNDRVMHYAPREHALEVRAELSVASLVPQGFVVGLTSVVWREAWKYGERAFRYCQHDVGHAIGALRYAVALLGWRLTMMPAWSEPEIATLLGLDRRAGDDDAEREEGECLLLVTAEAGAALPARDTLLDAARAARWMGRANRLSPGHESWPIIERVAAATRSACDRAPGGARSAEDVEAAAPSRHAPAPVDRAASGMAGSSARALMLQRRSAVAFDASSSLSRAAFVRMLARLRPGAPPLDAIWWPPQVHLILFVHRVDGLVPGLYAYVRDGAAVAGLREALRPEFLWERVPAPSEASAGVEDLFLLVPADVTFTANRLSCDQDIASNGFFSLGMLARFSPALAEYGEAFYRRLFWECGLIGQILYLDAEAAGARSTGIGCFYDDAVHDLLGLRDTRWQSLYHFSMGIPVDDPRIVAMPAYEGGW